MAMESARSATPCSIARTAPAIPPRWTANTSPAAATRGRCCVWHRGVRARPRTMWRCRGTCITVPMWAIKSACNSTRAHWECPGIESRRVSSDRSALGSRRIQSGLQLRANLAGLVLGTVHIHIEIAGLEARVLFVGQLGTRGHHPHTLRGLVERDDGRSALTGRAHMNVRHRPDYAHRLDGAADGFVRGNGDGSGTGRRRGHGRSLFGADQLHFHVGSVGCSTECDETRGGYERANSDSTEWLTHG